MKTTLLLLVSKRAFIAENNRKKLAISYKCAYVYIYVCSIFMCNSTVKEENKQGKVPPFPFTLNMFTRRQRKNKREKESMTCLLTISDYLMQAGNYDDKPSASHF